MDINLIIVAVYSYLLGSVPFGLVLTKIFLKKDIREIGSGNIGTTDVLRTGKKSLAIATLLLDLLKGYLSIAISFIYFENLISYSALICLLGHIFPVWLKFKGGKGVATYLGVILALSYKFFLIFGITWLVLSFLFRYASLSSIVSSLIVFVYSLVRLFKNNDSSSFNRLIINVHSSFLDKTFIENFVSKEISSDSQNINYNELENKFSSISHVKGVAIYKDLIGNLNIGISQYDPIARIISGKLSGNYINNEGHIFPISSRYSKRVLLLHLNDEFSNDKKMISSEFGKDLLEMINYINNDKFFSKIISEIEINSNKNIVIHPQFSKQKIIFGYPDDLEEKFEKINLFYNKIVPAKGWNTYKTVNVKFKNQIICDKS